MTYIIKPEFTDARVKYIPKGKSNWVAVERLGDAKQAVLKDLAEIGHPAVVKRSTKKEATPDEGDHS